jgi:hypothetical protein
MKNGKSHEEKGNGGARRRGVGTGLIPCCPWRVGGQAAPGRRRLSIDSRWGQLGAQFPKWFQPCATGVPFPHNHVIITELY